MNFALSNLFCLTKMIVFSIKQGISFFTLVPFPSPSHHHRKQPDICDDQILVQTHKGWAPQHSFPSLVIRPECLTAAGYQRECVYPAFLGFLYLAHPLRQMIQPKATESILWTDKTVYQRRKTKGPKPRKSDGVAWDSPATRQAVWAASAVRSRPPMLLFVRISLKQWHRKHSRQYNPRMGDLKKQPTDVSVQQIWQLGIFMKSSISVALPL